MEQWLQVASGDGETAAGGNGLKDFASELANDPVGRTRLEATAQRSTERLARMVERRVTVAEATGAAKPGAAKPEATPQAAQPTPAPAAAAPRAAPGRPPPAGAR